MQQQPRQGAYAPAGLRLPGAAPARRDDFRDNMRSPSLSTTSYESPRTPAVAFRPGAAMPSWSVVKDFDEPRPEDYLPYAYDASFHAKPAVPVALDQPRPEDYLPYPSSHAYGPYFHQAQPARAPAPSQNYGYEPGQYYAPADPGTHGYYGYVQQPAAASYYSPTGAQYAQHPRGNEAQYPFNASIAYGQPVPTRQSQQASPHRAPPNALQQPVESNALQLQTAAPQPAAPAHSPAASEMSEPDGEFEYVFDCPDCGTSFLSLAALHAHLFIQYRRGWCPGVP